jgi:secondary thiamine-phosphate synthase enzyme
MKQHAPIRIETIAAGPVTRQALGRFHVETPGPGFTDVTEAIAEWVSASGVANGVLTVFCRHTSASLTIQENADPDVQRDLMTALDRLAPRGAGYVHTIEGLDDMPSHIRAMVTGVSLSIPMSDGRLMLGTWQGIYLIEHRDAPHRREIVVHVIGA